MTTRMGVCNMWLATLLVIVAGSSGTMASSDSLVETVRAADERFLDISAALAEGYTPIPCASGQSRGQWECTTSTMRISTTIP